MSEHHLMDNLEEAAKAKTSGFRQFLENQNVVGIAVGLAVGAAASTLATSFINDIVMGPVGFIFGSPDGLKGLSVNLGMRNGVMATWNYGNFLANLINFIVIALVFYLIVKALGMDKKKKA